MPVPALACQMFFAELARLQPVIWRAPLMTGCADGAACQITVCPLVPESAAVKRSGLDSRYTPSASWTTMSPLMPATMERTAAWAPLSAQGWLLEQALPLPDGEA